MLHTVNVFNYRGISSLNYEHNILIIIDNHYYLFFLQLYR